MIKNAQRAGAKKRLLNNPTMEMGSPQPTNNGMVTKANIICRNIVRIKAWYVCVIILSMVVQCYHSFIILI